MVLRKVTSIDQEFPAMTVRGLFIAILLPMLALLLYIQHYPRVDSTIRKVPIERVVQSVQRTF